MLFSLTKEQNDIINSNKRFNFIMAGAGCGKTSTILELIKYKQTNRFLYITFTNQMLKEVKSKIKQDDHFRFLNFYTLNKKCFTFNSAGMSLTNDSLIKPLFFPNSKDYQNAIWTELNNNKNNEVYTIILNKIIEITPKVFWNEFETYKKYFLLCQSQKINPQHQKIFDLLLSTFKYYWEYIDQENYFYQNMPIYDVDYILIDEYQDLDSAKFEIIKKLILTHPKTKFYFAGDFNQQIYSFKEREISGDYFTKTNDFCKSIDENDVGFFTLSQCFRCDNKVINLANWIINNNTTKGIIDNNGNVVWKPMEFNDKAPIIPPIQWININKNNNDNNWLNHVTKLFLNDENNLFITFSNQNIFKMQKHLFMNGLRYVLTGMNEFFFCNIWKEDFWPAFILAFKHFSEDDECPQWIISKLYYALSSDKFISKKDKKEFVSLDSIWSETDYKKFISFISGDIDINDIAPSPFHKMFNLLKTNVLPIVEKLKKSSEHPATFRIFLSSQLRIGANKPNEIIEYISKVNPENIANYVYDCLNENANITLATIHSAKGIERSNVILLIDASQWEYSVTEENRRIWYVAYTRSNKFFNVVKTGNCYNWAFDNISKTFKNL